MSIKVKTMPGANVFYDDRYLDRVVDVVGTGVTKFVAHAGMPTDDTTGDPTQFTMTVTEAGAGDSTVVNSTNIDEIFLITTAANEYDGVNLQLKGTAFKLTSTNNFYFGCKMKISDATQSDLFIGLATVDTTLMATGSAHAIALGGDGLFFSKLDAVTTMYANTYLDGASTGSGAAGTIVADTFNFFEITWNGETVKFYVDNQLITSSISSLPDSAMTVSFNFRAGAAAAKTANIAELKCFQW